MEERAMRADSFSFHPADCIYTHFPADEDKTMDLGRLGEECRRFRQIYSDSMKNSLLLLNETFFFHIILDSGLYFVYAHNKPTVGR